MATKPDPPTGPSPIGRGSNHRDTPARMMTKLRHNEIGTYLMLQPYILH